MNVQMRNLGKIQKQIFPIGFGGASLSGEGKGYGFGAISEDDSVFLLRHAKDLGVNLIDLAPIYGFGAAEKRVGMAFKEKNLRDEIFIVDKGGVTWDLNKRVDINNSPKVIEKMLGESLKNLKTDFIDLYLIHWPDPRTDIRSSLEFLEREREKGKILNIGLGNTTKGDLVKALEITKNLTIQNEVNLFNDEITKIIEEDFSDFEFGIMGWGTLDKGILSGRVTNEARKYDKDDLRSWAPFWKKEKSIREKKYKAQERITQMIQSHDKDLTLLDVAIHFALSRKNLNVSLIGGRTKEQWNEIIKTLDKNINLDFLNEVKKEVDLILCPQK